MGVGSPNSSLSSWSIIPGVGGCEGSYPPGRMGGDSCGAGQEPDTRDRPQRPSRAGQAPGEQPPAHSSSYSPCQPVFPAPILRARPAFPQLQGEKFQFQRSGELEGGVGM